MEGVPATHLRVAVDFQELYAQLDDDQREQLLGGAASPPPGLTTEEFIAQMSFDGFDVWIDAEGFVRRVIVEIDLGSFGVFNSESLMSEFNEDFDIEPPSSFQPLSELGS